MTACLAHLQPTEVSRPELIRQRHLALSLRVVRCMMEFTMQSSKLASLPTSLLEQLTLEYSVSLDMEEAWVTLFSLSTETYFAVVIDVC
jgi:hypothetical protein